MAHRVLFFCDMAKNLENMAFLIIKLEFYFHLIFVNPQSRGVCWGKNFLQNHFCRDNFRFTVDFDQAEAYRNSTNQYLRARQWEDLTV